MGGLRRARVLGAGVRWWAAGGGRFGVVTLQCGCEQPSVWVQKSLPDVGDQLVQARVVCTSHSALLGEEIVNLSWATRAFAMACEL